VKDLSIKEYRALRLEVIQRDRGMCQICHILLSDGGGRTAPTYYNRAEVHHIVPLMEGGTNDMDNLIALCNWCHVGVHHIEKRGEAYDWTLIKGRASP